MADGTRTVKIKFDGSAKGLTAAAIKARAELKALQRQADDHSKTWDKLSDSAFSGLTRIASSAGSAALKISTLVAGVNAIATILPVLVQTVGVLALAPAALLAAGAAFAVIKLGTDGIKKAFTGLTPALDKVKSSVSGAFEKGLAPAVKNLAGILPKLTDELVNIARTMSAVATHTTLLLKTPESIRSMNTVLRGTGTLVSNLGKFLAPVVAGFINMGAVGIPILAKMTEGAGNVGQRFLDWTNSARGVETITKWIQGGIAAVRQLWSWLGDIVNIVGTVGKAFSDVGIGLPGLFGGATKELKEFLHTAEGQDALHALAETVKVIADTVSMVLNAALRQLGPILRDVAPFVQELVKVLGKDLTDAINTVGPILRGLFQFMSDNASWLAPLVATLLQVVLALKLIRKFSGLAQSALSLLPGTFGKSGAAAGTSFTGKLSGAIKGFGWAALGLSIVDGLTSSWFQEKSGGKVNGLFDAAVQGWFGGEGTGGKGIIPSIRENGKSFAGWLTDLFTHPAFGEDAADKLFHPWQAALDQAVEDTRRATSTIGGVWDMSLETTKEAAAQKSAEIRSRVSGGFLGAATDAIGATTSLVAGVTGGYWTMNAGVGLAVGAIQGTTTSGFWNTNAAVGGAVGAIQGTVASGFNAAVGSVAASTGQVPGIAANNFWAANGAIGRVGSAIIGTVAGIGSGIRGAANVDLSPVGAAIAQGLANGIKSRASAAIQAAKEMVAQAVAIAKSAAGVHSPSTVFFDIGKWFAPGLALGIESTTPQAIRSAKALSDKVVQASSASMNGLAAAAKEILDQYTRGGNVFEDFSFHGDSQTVRDYNDQITDMFGASGRANTYDDIVAFLRDLANRPGSSSVGGVGQAIDLTLDLGAGIQQRMAIEIDRQNRATVRAVTAGVGASR